MQVCTFQELYKGMRVIAGTARGVPLKAVPGDTTRPILDRVKTALFDIIRPSLADTAWLDMFSGTGAVGIEALSQGAASCVFLDLEPKAIATIQGNLKTTKLTAQAKIFKADAFRYIKNSQESFDVIYIAPPQFERLWAEALERVSALPGLLQGDGQIIVQIDPKEYEDLNLEMFKLSSRRKYGNTELLFYEKA